VNKNTSFDEQIFNFSTLIFRVLTIFTATTRLPRFFLAITAFSGPLLFQLATKPLPRKPAIPSAARLCWFSQGDAIATKENFFRMKLSIFD
jgi:hypothetical protein